MLRTHLAVSLFALASLVGCAGAGTGTGSGTGGGTGGSAGGGAYARFASATFYVMGIPAVPTDPASTLTTSGACTVTQCDHDGGMGPRIADAGTEVGAGTVTVSVGTDRLTLVGGIGISNGLAC